MPTEYAKAYEINSLLNAEEVYRYADQPRGHEPTIMQPGDEEIAPTSP